MKYCFKTMSFILAVIIMCTCVGCGLATNTNEQLSVTYNKKSVSLPCKVSEVLKLGFEFKPQDDSEYYTHVPFTMPTCDIVAKDDAQTEVLLSIAYEENSNMKERMVIGLSTNSTKVKVNDIVIGKTILEEVCTEYGRTESEQSLTIEDAEANMQYDNIDKPTLFFSKNITPKHNYNFVDFIFEFDNKNGTSVVSNISARLSQNFRD